MILHWPMLVIIIISAALISFHMINGWITIRKHTKHKPQQILRKQPISVLVPCYNEENTVKSSILNVEDIINAYENVEYIFINDGSTDDTLQKLKEELSLFETQRHFNQTLHHQPIQKIFQSSRYDNVYVIDKINGGKADSLNAGINFAENELIVTLDADTLLDKNALPIVSDSFQDENVIAGGGIVNILQSSEYSTGKLQLRKLKFIIRVQILDYLKGFIILKSSLARLNALNVVSGAFGVFRKSLLNEIGGYRVTVGEDMDITLKLQLYAMSNKGKKIIFIPDAIAYTECPTTWRDLFSQRIRWHKAYVDCLITYSRALIKRFFKGGLPFFFLIDTTVIGVLFTMYSFFYLAYLSVVEHSDRSLFILSVYFISISIISISNNILALYLYKKMGGKLSDRNFIALVRTMIGDILVFRMLIALFMILGTVFYFTSRHRWNKVSRTGYKYYSKGA